MEPRKPLPEPRRPEAAQPEGCLVAAVRIPVRIVVLVLVLPVRMVWDGLVVAWRFLTDTVFRPAGRALAWLGRALFVWPFVGLWRYVLVPLGRGLAWLGKVLVVLPLVWLYRAVLTPIGHGFLWAGRAFVAGLVWLYARVLTPIGHGFLWVGRGIVAGLVWVYRAVLTPIGHGFLWVGRGIVAGLGWVYASLLTPVGRAFLWLLRGIGLGLVALGTAVFTAVAWLVRYLLVVPALWLYQWVLTPIGHALVWTVRGIGLGLYWIGRVLIVLPVLGLWRWVLVPVGRALAVVGRETGDALGHAWRVAGRISLAVGRFFGTLFRWIFVEPVRWVYRTVLTPVGHAVRDAVLRPCAEAARAVGRGTRQALASARESVRQARADFRRMLFGEPRKREAVDRREPRGAGTRTLGSSTTALTKD
ncbi:hypothetical protein [Streptomyces sp. DI166]|uniref:hypothetical protein n=1 Tax=Streptomyces sp. DI166 TaxID=1839783 RepID=UPI000B8371C9|nr:hypothetical protein [Streptomyces sp. DI166]